MRLTVRVYPGARTTAVGGRYGTATPAVLVVRVTERAADGRANIATVRALARAFDVPTSAVRIHAGSVQRTKIIDIDGADPRRLDELLVVAAD